MAGTKRKGEDSGGGDAREAKRQRDSSTMHDYNIFTIRLSDTGSDHKSFQVHLNKAIKSTGHFSKEIQSGRGFAYPKVVSTRFWEWNVEVAELYRTWLYTGTIPFEDLAERTRQTSLADSKAGNSQDNLIRLFVLAEGVDDRDFCNYTMDRLIEIYEQTGQFPAIKDYGCKSSFSFAGYSPLALTTSHMRSLVIDLWLYNNPPVEIIEALHGFNKILYDHDIYGGMRRSGIPFISTGLSLLDQIHITQLIEEVMKRLANAFGTMKLGRNDLAPSTANRKLYHYAEDANGDWKKLSRQLDMTSYAKAARIDET